MKKSVAFLLVVCAVLAAALPHTKFHLTQAESGEESSEESSMEEYASFGKIGFVVGLCNCVLPKGEESSGEESSENSVSRFDCYCREGDATVSEESSEESSGEESSQLIFNPRANITGQVLLGCTCLFKPKSESSEESSEESSGMASNQTFLLPTYTGREIVPIDCMCKDLDEKTINITSSPLLNQLVVPIINSSSKINYVGDQVIAADIPLSKAQDLNKLIPIWCNASGAQAPFFNGTVRNATGEKAFFARCSPKLNQVPSINFTTTAGSVQFTTVPVQLAKWKKALWGVDLTTMTGLPQGQIANVLGLNATWTSVQFKLNNASQAVQAPPFLQIGPDVLNTFPVIQSPNLQGVLVRLRKRYLF